MGGGGGGGGGEGALASLPPPLPLSTPLHEPDDNESVIMGTQCHGCMQLAPMANHVVQVCRLFNGFLSKSLSIPETEWLLVTST